MTKEGQGDANVAVTGPGSRSRRSSWPILFLAVLFAVATFLTWYFTWFGRELSETDISKYLADDKHPRHMQHALLQIQQRIEHGDAEAKQWYPKILELSGNPESEFRLTVAWVMGFDNKSAEFHGALLRLLKDPEPLVRRNAALALVRFNDASGREELMATLRPYPVNAPVPGVVSSTLNERSQVAHGTLLARINRADGGVLEIRSPLPGKIDRLFAHDGSAVVIGAPVLTINSDSNSLWEVLRGLAVVGQSEDLPEIERYGKGAAALPEQIKEQAALTARAIQSRTGQKSQTVTQ